MDRRAHGSVPIHTQVAGSFALAGGGTGPPSTSGARPPGMPLCRDARAQMAPKKQFRAELFFYITMHTTLFYLITPYVLCTTPVHTYQKVSDPAWRGRSASFSVARAHYMSIDGTGRAVA